MNKSRVAAYLRHNPYTEYLCTTPGITEFSRWDGSKRTGRRPRRCHRLRPMLRFSPQSLPYRERVAYLLLLVRVPRRGNVRQVFPLALANYGSGTQPRETPAHDGSTTLHGVGVSVENASVGALWWVILCSLEHTREQGRMPEPWPIVSG